MIDEIDRIKHLGYSDYEAELIYEAGLLFANIALKNKHDCIISVLTVLENLAK